MFDRLSDIRTFPVIGGTEDYAMLYTPRLSGSRGVMRTLTQHRGEEFNPRVYLRSFELLTHPMPTSPRL